MTEEEIKALAQRLNERINVPLVSETKEEKILIKIVMMALSMDFADASRTQRYDGK